MYLFVANYRGGSENSLVMATLIIISGTLHIGKQVDQLFKDCAG